MGGKEVGDHPGKRDSNTRGHSDRPCRLVYTTSFTPEGSLAKSYSEFQHIKRIIQPNAKQLAALQISNGTE